MISAARTLHAGLVIGGALAASGAFAQSPETPAEIPAVDPAAVQAVRDMGAKLRALPAFSGEAMLIWEQVFDDGEKNAVIEQVSLQADPPHGLRVEVSSPDRSRIFYYDGEKAALWSPISRLYAEIDQKGPLPEMISHMAEEYDLELPLADLFFWGRDEEDIAALEAARFVGHARIGGRVCDQYAFTQGDVDWQLWIEDSESTLPCAYMIVDRTDEARPVFHATVTITPEAEYADRRFSFAPPEDATRIPIAKAEAPEEDPADAPTEDSN
ncbi:MAG: DUF2092 domain-containing protein [Pikeienuella sp.]